MSNSVQHVSSNKSNISTPLSPLPHTKAIKFPNPDCCTQSPKKTSVFHSPTEQTSNRNRRLYINIHKPCPPQPPQQTLSVSKQTPRTFRASTREGSFPPQKKPSKHGPQRKAIVKGKPTELSVFQLAVCGCLTLQLPCPRLCPRGGPGRAHTSSTEQSPG